MSIRPFGVVIFRNNMKTIGIDPGLMHTGWAIIEKSGNNLMYRGSGVIRSVKMRKTENTMSSTQCFTLRLTYIFHSLDEIIKHHKPYAAAIENTYVNINYESSLKLAQARAAALLACGTNDIHAYEYQAKTVKKMLVGSGSANKEQMVRMVNMYLKNITTVKLLDEADAIAIAICHAYST